MWYQGIWPAEIFPRGLWPGQPGEAAVRMHIRRHDGVEFLTAILEFEEGLSGPIGLPGSGVVVRLPGTVSVGDAWQVEAVATPEIDLDATVAALEAAGEDVLTHLFGVPTAPPYDAYKAAWLDRLLPAVDRLAAVLLAVALRTEEAGRRRVT